MATLVGMSTLSAVAQMTPVGLWKTISDKDGLVTSEVRIVENAGVLSGVKRSGISARACADDNDFSLDRIHELKSYAAFERPLRPSGPTL